MGDDRYPIGARFDEAFADKSARVNALTTEEWKAETATGSCDLDHWSTHKTVSCQLIFFLWREKEILICENKPSIQCNLAMIATRYEHDPIFDEGGSHKHLFGWRV